MMLLKMHPWSIWYRVPDVRSSSSMSIVGIMSAKKKKIFRNFLEMECQRMDSYSCCDGHLGQQLLRKVNRLMQRVLELLLQQLEQ
ncbi:hypothetical protein Tco_1300986 [Tanacetum coccineum]